VARGTGEAQLSPGIGGIQVWGVVFWLWRVFGRQKNEVVVMDRFDWRMQSPRKRVRTDCDLNGLRVSFLRGGERPKRGPARTAVRVRGGWE
jgi:hypothetical protein